MKNKRKKKKKRFTIYVDNSTCDVLMNRLFVREQLALDNFRCRREVVHGHQYKIDEKQS